MVSSAAGIYPFYQIPLYAAAKHGVVGFMRSLAPSLAKENIRVNCTLPGAVRTNLIPSWDSFPDEQFTTMDNIVSAVVGILDDPTLTGKAVEISQGEVYYREQHDFCDAEMKQVMGAAGESSYQWHAIPIRAMMEWISSTACRRVLGSEKSNYE